jgi:hypothetical protein
MGLVLPIWLEYLSLRSENGINTKSRKSGYIIRTIHAKTTIATDTTVNIFLSIGIQLFYDFNANTLIRRRSVWREKIWDL